MTDRMIDRMFEVSKFVGAQEAGLKRKVAALEDEVRYLRGVYADAGECFLKADAENKKLANEIADRLLGSSIDGKTIKELVSENKKLREVLAFYGDVKNWRSPSTGFALQYDPIPSAIRADNGSRARTALGETK